MHENRPKRVQGAARARRIPHRFAALPFVVAALLFAHGPATAAPATPAPVEARVDTRMHASDARSSAPSTDADAERYAERERQAGELAEYRGGHAVIISGGALLVIVLLALILV